MSKDDQGLGGRSVAALAGWATLAAVVALIATLTFSAAAAAQSTPFAADFGYSPAAPTAGQVVTFTSTSTARAGTVLVSESWDLDGDRRLDASGRQVTNTYTAPGTYTVTLLVLNDRGRIRAASKDVTVAAAPPPPAPAPTPTPQPAPSPQPAPTPAPAPVPPPPSAREPLPPSTTGSATAAPPPTAIAPFPVVRIMGSYSTAGVRLRLVAVTAPTGVTITVRCQGRGCPYRQRGPFLVRRSGTRAAASGRHVQIGGFRDRLLRPGVRLRILVAHPRQIGKYTRFTIRGGSPPIRADGCVQPGGDRVFSC